MYRLILHKTVGKGTKETTTEASGVKLLSIPKLNFFQYNHKNSFPAAFSLAENQPYRFRLGVVAGGGVVDSADRP